MEVDCSGYGAASVVRASLRHVIEDVMDGNITTGKLRYELAYIYHYLLKKCQPTISTYCWP